MPRAYVKGLKQRPGEDAGSECEQDGCTTTASSSWSKGVCAACRSKAVRDGTSCTALSNVSNEVEAVLRRANYAAAAAAMATGAPTLLPVAQATVLPVALVGEPQPVEAQPDPQAVAAAERRAAEAERRAAAAEARAADATKKLERVLLTITDRLFAELGKHDDEVPARRVKRWTGLSCAEMWPHHKAMKVIDRMPYDREHDNNKYVRDEWD